MADRVAATLRATCCSADVICLTEKRFFFTANLQA